jgi:hypothetical protein
MIRLLAIFMLAVTSVLPIASQAQPVQSPPRLALETVGGDTTFAAIAEPGDTIRDQIRFGADRATTATLRIANLTSPPNGGIVPVPSASLTAPATWLGLETGDVELAAESAITRAIEVTVPPTAAPGQYLAAVILEASAPAADDVQLPQTSRATLIVAITVAGELDAAFDLDAPTLEQRAAGLTLVVPISNTGNVTLAPAGELTIDPASGDLVTVPVTLGPIIPGVTTTIEVPLNDLPGGEAELRLTLADVATGARAQITNATVEIPAPEADAPNPPTNDATPPGPYTPDGVPVDVTIRNAHLTPDGSPIESVTVTADLVNIGEPVGPVSLVMDVSRDGGTIETVTLVDFASVPRASLSLNTTYAPEDGFTPGLWTFRLRLVDADGAIVAQTGTFAKLDLT